MPQSMLIKSNSHVVHSDVTKYPSLISWKSDCTCYFRAFVNCTGIKCLFNYDKVACGNDDRGIVV